MRSFTTSVALSLLSSLAFAHDAPVPGGPIFVSQAEAPDDSSEWSWDWGGVLGVEDRVYGNGNTKQDGLETETAALIFEGRSASGLRLWIEADLDGEDTRNNLAEAWLEIPLAEQTWLRVGQMRFDQGSESATRAEDRPLLGVGFPPWLDGRTDLGVQLDGYAGEQLWYQLGLGAGQGFDASGRRRTGEQVSARLVLTPPRDEEGAFTGPFVGLGLSHAFDADDGLQIENPLEQAVFTTPRLDGDSATYVHLEGGWRGEGWRFGAETVRGEVTDVQLPGGGSTDADQLGTWSAWLAVQLRGKSPVWQRGRYLPHPSTRVARAEGEPEPVMPIELAVRYSNADIDRDLITSGVTNFAASTQEVRTFSAALSAQVDPDARFALQWTKTIADQELRTFGARNRDSSWSLRLDYRLGRAGRQGPASDAPR